MSKFFINLLKVNAMQHYETDRKSMETIISLSIEIRDLPTLSTVITRLEQIPNVGSVRRTS